MPSAEPNHSPRQCAGYGSADPACVASPGGQLTRQDVNIAVVLPLAGTASSIGPRKCAAGIAGVLRLAADHPDPWTGSRSATEASTRAKPRICLAGSLHGRFCSSI
jgi:hypothetical protein